MVCSLGERLVPLVNGLLRQERHNIEPLDELDVILTEELKL